MTVDPADCPWGEWHTPAKPGDEWIPCIGCHSPQALPPPPMFWPDDLWRYLIEKQPREIVLGNDEPDEDGTYGEFVVPISGGLYVTLLAKMSDALKRSGYELVREHELTELKERAGVSPLWQTGRPL